MEAMCEPEIIGRRYTAKLCDWLIFNYGAVACGCILGNESASEAALREQRGGGGDSDRFGPKCRDLEIPRFCRLAFMDHIA